MRIKQGIYNGDLGLTEQTDDNKVYVRLIPRLDLTKNTEQNRQMRTFTGNKKQPSFNVRPPQRLFNQKTVSKGQLETKKFDGRTYTLFKR